MIVAVDNYIRVYGGGQNEEFINSSEIYDVRLDMCVVLVASPKLYDCIYVALYSWFELPDMLYSRGDSAAALIPAVGAMRINPKEKNLMVYSFRDATSTS